MLKLLVWGLSAGMVLTAMSVAAGFQPCKRPFILMNEAEIEGARSRLKEPWAEEALKASLYLEADGRQPASPYHEAFQVMVRGDEGAAEAEKQKLLAFIGEDIVPSKPRKKR